MTGFSVIIPARYASTRLPGKPLRDIAGKPLIQHVFDCAQASGAEQVIVATDDERIAQVVKKLGAQVCMTSAQHRSGTERLAEVVTTLRLPKDRIIVNLQGDEPLIPPTIIHQVAENLARHPPASVATLCAALEHAADLFDPHVVKVVRDKEDYALYFSRAPIPWDRSAFADDDVRELPHPHYFRHIGIYAYRAGFIQEYVNWPECELERAEALEQLRVLWNGGKIHVAEALALPGPGVDTEEDLARAEILLGSTASASCFKAVK